MSAPAVEEIRTDVVIIGAGTAGLAAALAAGRRPVLVLATRPPGRSGSSPAAQGGIAVALGEDDDPELHARDTLAAGCGLCDPDVVRLVTREGPERVGDLLRLGARFDRAPGGGLARGREGAHHRRRVVHAAGDATGAEVVRTLAAAAASAANIGILPGWWVERLVMEGGRCVGVVAVSTRGRRLAVVAPAVVLAAGGIGRLYARTTNPEPGGAAVLGMAALAGARLADLEMVQFHPTALAGAGDPMPLLTEALRGDGARLIDGRGRPIMAGVHPDGDLAPRDVVARGIRCVEADGGRVFLDATGLARELPRRFPTVFRICRSHGIDPSRDPIPVSPAAHYHMGGVLVDTAGRTSVPGLWACGEVACTGLHGANRLASNSLLEALVFGHRAGRDVGAAMLPVPDGRAVRRAARRAGALPSGGRTVDGRRRALRRIMWSRVGLERDARGLRAAYREILRLGADLPPAAGRLRHELEVARLVVRAAMARRRSCGSHFRTDAPQGSGGEPYRLVVVAGGERVWRVPVAAVHPRVNAGVEVAL